MTCRNNADDWEKQLHTLTLAHSRVWRKYCVCTLGKFSKHINILHFGHLARAPIMTHLRQTQRLEAVCLLNLNHAAWLSTIMLNQNVVTFSSCPLNPHLQWSHKLLQMYCSIFVYVYLCLCLFVHHRAIVHCFYEVFWVTLFNNKTLWEFFCVLALLQNYTPILRGCAVIKLSAE